MFDSLFPTGWSTLKKLLFLRMVARGGGEGTVWRHISGIAPLIIEDALEHPMKSLVQHGKLYVNGGDIYCNNGKLVAVDDELPLGFKRITSIRFDGDFWYDTGEALTGDDDVTMTLANTSSSGQNVFGSYNGTSAGTKNFSLYIYGGGSTSSSYFRYGDQLARPKFGSNEHTITFGKSGTDGFSTDVSVTPDTFETPANAYIGMLPNSSSAAYTGSIIGNILVSDRLKYIPCERQSDGAVGYYEAVKGVFLEPSGTGTPVKGSYDTSHNTVIATEGTPEEMFVGIRSNLVSGWIEGYYLDGGTGKARFNAGCHYTKAIFVKAGKTYEASLTVGTTGTNTIVAYTNSDNPEIGSPDNYLKTIASIATSNPALVFEPFTLDTDCYIRLSCSNQSSNVVIREQGSPDEDEGETATVVNLYAFNDIEDTHDIITGEVVRQINICVYDGTQDVGDNYIGSKQVGHIIIYPKSEPETEYVTPQPLSTLAFDNMIDVRANVDDIEIDATYAASGADTLPLTDVGLVDLMVLQE